MATRLSRSGARAGQKNRRCACSTPREDETDAVQRDLQGEHGQQAGSDVHLRRAEPADGERDDGAGREPDDGSQRHQHGERPAEQGGGDAVDVAVERSGQRQRMSGTTALASAPPAMTSNSTFGSVFAEPYASPRPAGPTSDARASHRREPDDAAGNVDDGDHGGRAGEATGQPPGVHRRASASPASPAVDRTQPRRALDHPRKLTLSLARVRATTPASRARRTGRGAADDGRRAERGTEGVRAAVTEHVPLVEVATDAGDDAAQARGRQWTAAAPAAAARRRAHRPSARDPGAGRAGSPGWPSRRSVPRRRRRRPPADPADGAPPQLPHGDRSGQRGRWRRSRSP